MTNFIADTARIGKDCTLGHNVVILDNVQIGDNVYIGHNVVIHEGTRVGNGSFVDDGSILGRVPRSGSLSRKKASKELQPLEIGKDCVISSHVILYRGTKIADEVMIGDLVSIREQNVIGEKSIIARLISMEPRTVIGKRVRTAAVTHLTSDMVIEDDAFIGSHISTTNDNKMGRGVAGIYKGPHIKRGARIGSNATLLPGVVIGEEAVVAAGALVSRDVPDRKIVMGVPAKVVRDVSEDELLPKKEKPH
jgi:UDP-2-acetamido-3-amino-2,3-dideoxy-glucuronate N-acetyltransferase